LRDLRKEEREVKQTPQIIFQDEHLLIINKPAGMIVNRAETTQGQVTVQDWAKDNYQFPLADNDSLRNGVVHRLDKETSGLLILAKTEQAFLSCQAQFKQRQVKKKYLALVHGCVSPPQGTIQASITRNPFNRQKFGVFLGGREAMTKYRKIKDYQQKGEKFSLLELFPQTGRTHQLRVHLKFINHPIVADEKYVGRKTFKKDKTWCPRLFLHAAGLSFVHPVSGQKIDLSSQLPSDLRLAMMNLE
jgi:23S rRNA pseudouridine1911/1915/1917 synthase